MSVYTLQHLTEKGNDFIDKLTLFYTSHFSQCPCLAFFSFLNKAKECVNVTFTSFYFIIYLSCGEIEQPISARNGEVCLEILV